MSTYTEKHRRTYLKNKDRIRERNKEYNKIYKAEYYRLNKEKWQEYKENQRKAKFLKLQQAIFNQT